MSGSNFIPQNTQGILGDGILGDVYHIIRWQKGSEEGMVPNNIYYLIYTLTSFASGIYYKV